MVTYGRERTCDPCQSSVDYGHMTKKTQHTLKRGRISLLIVVTVYGRIEEDEEQGEEENICALAYSILRCDLCPVQGLTIIGEPQLTCFAIGSNDPDVHILAVGDVMESKGNVQMTLSVLT